jgi:hypothetical protein
MKKFITLFIIISLLVSNVDAQLIQNFDYTSTGNTANDTLVNPALGGSVWVKHSGTGTPIKWISSGLTYTGYAGSGVGGAVTFAHGSGSREDVNIALQDSFKTGTVYTSFLLNVSASGGTTGDYFLHLLASNGASAGSDFKGRLFIKDGATTGTFKLGLSKGSAAASAVFTTLDYTVGQTYLVVLKHEIVAGSANDIISAFIFTSGVPATEPSAADLTATDNTVSDLSKVYGLAIRQGTVGTSAAIIDGIRVATEWVNAPLPLSLKSFNGQVVNKEVSLVWNTTNEINVDGFAIEKSNDARNFKQIGFVAAKNAATATYSFNDVLETGVNYYRLKMSDKDGSFKYSSIVALNSKPTTKLEVYPNPVKNTATLTHELAGTKATIKVVSIEGKNIVSQNIQTGATQSTIDVSKLVRGNYIIVFENEGTRTSVQFVKQ